MPNSSLALRGKLDVNPFRVSFPSPPASRRGLPIRVIAEDQAPIGRGLERAHAFPESHDLEPYDAPPLTSASAFLRAGVVLGGESMEMAASRAPRGSTISLVQDLIEPRHSASAARIGIK